ncbi:GNAT family N-acetyltransferase [Curtobacterium sp. Leaf261]|uniref:GNAT family N-acetyltransferase n=1 Tax=Curtobacterium sp. Leaf261 TaxID=1736311 RepID=UPI0007008635|nr:GNAT family N-acetyltransferase [Curtobacterium sp. Leaf261]KQO60021.1 hypothetical protein ASF23_15340 [Curtobacterium sp. Leaf261]
MDDGPAPSAVIRVSGRADLDACVALWVAACADRDGRAIDGVADRARPKFEDRVLWLTAWQGARLDGFLLATEPGSGMPTDPDGAVVVALLAVAPGHQTRGLGRALLRSATDSLAGLGYEHAVLHALEENVVATHLYRSEGWEALGPTRTHSLLGRPVRTFTRSLR